MRIRAVEFPAKNHVVVLEEPLADSPLQPSEVLLQNEVTLISAGTELARLAGIEPGMGFPARPGYAAIGRVAAAGSAVADFNVGDRVFYAGKHCSAQRFEHGQSHQWGRLYPVPDDLAPEDAVFVCLAQIAMIAPCVTQLDLHDTVAVFGLGIIGNLAAQLYQHMGARVIALDPVPSRCELARAAGIATVLDVPPDQQIAALKELTGGAGAHVTVDAAGHSAVVMNCINATALFGQVILLGTPRAALQGNLTDAFHAIHSNGLVVRGAHMWRIPAMDVREVKKTVAWSYRTLFDLMRNGVLNIAPLRSHCVPPEQAPLMYDGLRHHPDQFWGVVLDWRAH